MERSGRSRLLVVVGDPVEHSLSPVMHNAAFAALGLDAVYVALRVDTVSVPHVFRALEASGVAGNVTVPHKVAVAALLIRLTGAAKELGAVNTFWPEEGRLVGDNTDVLGVAAAVERLDVDGPWAVAGTGGAARAVAAAAKSRGVPLLVSSRSAQRGRDFVEWANALGVDKTEVDDGREVGLLVNTTPLGLRSDDALPFDDAGVERAEAAFDTVYAHGGTRWIAQFVRAGKPAIDGRVMLLGQGAGAFERFFPGLRAPMQVMAAAVERGLSRS